MMTPERKIVVMENLLRMIIRKKEFSFESFPRELGNIPKKVEASVDEIKLVLGPIFSDLVREMFEIKES